jgi:hypothetical protein
MASVGEDRCSTGMKSLLCMLLIGWPLLVGSGATACEKHLNGHQSSSATAAEAARR